MLKIKNVLPKVFLLACILMCMAAEKVRLVKTKVTENITILVPQDWQPMDALDFSQRYPSVRAPLAAYTNQERLVDFSINVSATQWPDADKAIAKEFFKASLLNTFDRVDMIKEGVQIINKKEYIFFEFDSRINGNKRQEGFQDPIMRYTYIQYLIEPGKTLVFSFNCPRRLKDQWQPVARDMMNGLRIK